jgi:hypothetical protein
MDLPERFQIESATVSGMFQRCPTAVLVSCRDGTSLPRWEIESCKTMDFALLLNTSSTAEE